MGMPGIGEKIRFTPTGFFGEKDFEFGGKVIRKEVTGTVTYIHPLGRFYLITYEVFGVKLRECFLPRAELCRAVRKCR